MPIDRENAIPLSALQGAFFTGGANGSLALPSNGTVIKNRSLRDTLISPSFRAVSVDGKVSLRNSALRSRDRMVDTAQLPTGVETLYDQKDSYLTNRINFADTDWVGNVLTLLIPKTHAFYGSYLDDQPPGIQVFRRTGTAGDYSYERLDTAVPTVETGFRASYLTCGLTPNNHETPWVLLANGCFSITVNGKPYDVALVNFVGDASMADVAASIESSLTVLGAPVTVAWSTDHFIITATATSGESDIGYLRTNNSGSFTDISKPNWMGGEKGFAVKTPGLWDVWKVELNKPGATAVFSGLIQII